MLHIGGGPACGGMLVGIQSRALSEVTDFAFLFGFYVPYVLCGSENLAAISSTRSGTWFPFPARNALQTVRPYGIVQ